MNNKYYTQGNYYYKSTDEYSIVLTDKDDEFGWEFSTPIPDGFWRGLKEITQKEFQEVNQRVLNRIEQLEV